MCTEPGEIYKSTDAVWSINFSFTLNNIEVYDTKGKLITSYKSTKTINSLPIGIYLIVSEEATFRIIVN
ncbi:hypothetical protein FRY74_08820 [Vicingus serpentipes]|uniref:T9SS type A sorting domain-containing protein n=1 Tax=Vicingus serpentipes TaxID=1926625 RepID=A0A5C6RRM5_9FLAO|nr:hypothetical protein [Vicingus serpentipes]TXB64545.1 hypothetical protein FRY74_08820 [Vicingus serpentipes]